MATVEITQYSLLTKDLKNQSVQAPQEPSLDTQIVTFTTANDSTTLQEKANLVRIKTNVATYLKFDGTATASSMSMAADTVEYFGVQPGTLISCYDGTT